MPSAIQARDIASPRERRIPCPECPVTFPRFYLENGEKKSGHRLMDLHMDQEHSGEHET